jgi:NAD(P)-dependent dehydrogenase (short-subunit alcohol dehydrogenase family)
VSRFDDMTALVTGAGSGIGRAAAQRLGAEGARVLLAGRRESALAETAMAIGPGAHIFAVDVASPAEVETVMARLLETHGAPQIVVHAAGQTVLGALHELSDAEWDRQFDVNVRSIQLLTRALWQPMVSNGGGAVVTVASTASYGGFPQDAAYCASKGAVLALTRAMALDGAPAGIRVNAVCPGYIDTPNLRGYFDAQAEPGAAEASAAGAAPLRRLGGPDEVGAAIAFLASRDASFITGASLLVDGGLLAQVPLS